ncbi:hypothetical protein [Parasphaerochaeta coccoides]|uniref:Uncharacterized protein n=1 Tax=Parasphaerochaeta coccoides (strain ATCC BAA-1237 / DSM 17374 / SPN1) TaxID=760011 RepID=F4GM42_PARC1|nr:hypothetical protein [Parasphaerochaeta coccoides]AEC02517.1 hypothetical protein Spico_1309 [Parasphaerochaeta coccoides DSM 17374]
MVALNLLYVFSPIVSVVLEITIVILLALILKAVRKPSSIHEETVEPATSATSLPPYAVISNPPSSVVSKDAEIAAAIAVALDKSKK